MNISVLGNIVFAVNSLGLAFIALRNRRSRQNTLFALLNGFFALWSVVLILFDHPLIGTPDIWIRLNYVIAPTLNLLLFAYIWYVDIPWKGRFSIPLAIFGCFYGFLFWSLYATEYFIVEIVHHSWGNQAILGYAYWVMVLFSLVMVTWTIIVLSHKYNSSSGTGKLRLKYIFLGLITWLVIVCTTNMLLPLLQDFRYIWIGPLSGNIFSAVIVYTILRYRLLDIQLVMKRGLVYSILLGTITILYSLVVILVQSFIFPAGQHGLEPSSIIAVLVIVFTLEPIKRAVERFTEGIFFKTRYDIEQTLLALSKNMAGTVDLSQLMTKLISTLSRTLQPQGIGLWLLTDKVGGTRHSLVKKEGTLKPTAKEVTRMIKCLSDHGRASILITEELTRQHETHSNSTNDQSEIIGLLERDQVAVFIPLVYKDQWLGAILLQNKKSQDAYNSEDIRLLDLISHQAAMALDNAALYAQMEDRIDQRTSELQKANTRITQQVLELETANKHLLTLDQAKNEFLSIASHQLRTPLSAIRGYLSMLTEGDYGTLESKQMEAVQKADENVVRLVATVNDLLSLARIEAGKGAAGLRTEIVDLRTIVDTITDELSQKAKNKGLELKWTRPQEAVEVMIDREKFSQAVLNIVDNGLNYTLQGSVEVILTRSADAVQFQVKDTGIGITEDDKTNIFKKFYRTGEAVKAKPDGTGIGLYICKTIVEAHGGRIWMESESGRGTSVFVEIRSV